MSDFISSLKDLEEELPAPRPNAKKETFPCPKCHGTGIWKGGYVRVVEGKCHACNGKGFFKTSPEFRAKAAQKRKEKVAQQAADNAMAFKSAHPQLVEYIAEVRSWNQFARSLGESVLKYGRLTEKQLAAAYKMYHKHVAKQEQKEADVKVIELTRINEMLNTAKDNGIKKPILRVGETQISIAPASGKNAGCLYVKHNGNYQGKITEAGKFYKVGSADAGIQSELETIAENPRDAVVKHGRVTGKCSCCGRELTNKASIEAGIGPVCAENWGL